MKYRFFLPCRLIRCYSANPAGRSELRAGKGGRIDDPGLQYTTQLAILPYVVAVLSIAPPMTKLRVHSFTISLDGFGAGPHQDLKNPHGIGGTALHEWVFATRTFRQMIGCDGGTTGIDDDFVARGFHNTGAWILGRNMFAPIRGPWPDDIWTDKVDCNAPIWE